LGFWRLDDTGSAILGRNRVDLAVGGIYQADVVNGHRKVWYIGQLEGGKL
jgi:membrane-bound lytic murein transglycosylase